MAYIDDVNKVLRDINEVPLTSSQFVNARGLQAFVKEAVNRAYFDVLNENPEWTFMVQQLPLEANTQTLLTTEADKVWLKLPDVVSKIDEENIYLDGEYELEYISFSRYNRELRPIGEKGLPRYVFLDSTRKSLGFYPTPDSVFTLHTTAWLEPKALVDETDEMLIPERYYNVVLSKARKYAWQFRGDVEQAGVAGSEYNTALRNMKHGTGIVVANRMRAI